jgi:beta-lactamase regulating signal transducer with metallopeptidase domain
MDNFVLYIIKANITLTVLFMVYWFLLRQETYFNFNRLFLILIPSFALILPLIEFKLPEFLSNGSFHYLNLEQFRTDTPLIINTPTTSQISLSGEQAEVPDPFIVIRIIYLTGILITSGLFVHRLIQVGKMIYKNGSEKLGNLMIISPDREISPFSFFRYVIINKRNYTIEDYRQIVMHENIHYKQRHTVDLLLFEFMRIIFWYNPLIYIIAYSLRNTHEYLADRGVLLHGFDKKIYQMLILRQSVALPHFSMANTFAFSQTKRRIIMLNRNLSSYFSKIKMLVIIPTLFILFGLFNIPTGAIDVPLITDTTLQFELPVREGRVTQKFEMGINPFTKKEVFHKGMDIAAPRGTNIYASEDGIVIMADSLKGHGNKIVLQHANGFTTHYSHLFKIIISNDNKHVKGTIIGLVGSTGLSTAPHLHFEIRKDGEAVDPTEYLDFSNYGQK